MPSLAGNDEALAATCAASLVSENSLAHPPYPEYFTRASMSFANKLFDADVAALGYTFNETDAIYGPQVHLP